MVIGAGPHGGGRWWDGLGACDAKVTTARGTWVVLLEAAPNAEASLVDIGTVWATLRAIGDEGAVALHAPDRVAIQVRIEAADVALALVVALARWRQAAVAHAPAGWNVVRAEVLTPEELERDCERC